MTWPFITPTARGWRCSRVSLAAGQTTLCPDIEGVLNFDHWPKQILGKGKCQDHNFKISFSHSFQTSCEQSHLGIYMWQMTYKWFCFRGLGSFLEVGLGNWEWDQLPLTSFLPRLGPWCYEKVKNKKNKQTKKITLWVYFIDQQCCSFIIQYYIIIKLLSLRSKYEITIIHELFSHQWDVGCQIISAFGMFRSCKTKRERAVSCLHLPTSHCNKNR